jgi:hypothetical protein
MLVFDPSCEFLPLYLLSVVLFGSISLSHQLVLECKKDNERGKGGKAIFFNQQIFLGSFPNCKSQTGVG